MPWYFAQRGKKLRRIRLWHYLAWLSWKIFGANQKSEKFYKNLKFSGWRSRVRKLVWTVKMLLKVSSIDSRRVDTDSFLGKKVSFWTESGRGLLEKGRSQKRKAPLCSGGHIYLLYKVSSGSEHFCKILMPSPSQYPHRTPLKSMKSGIWNDKHREKYFREALKMKVSLL